MNTKPDDDLDATAELPQLDLQTASLLSPLAGAADAGDTVSAPFPDIADVAPTPADWPVLDELLTVRDRIVDLEAALLDAELRLAKLDRQHQELQLHHAELSTHDAEVTRDRERLDAERVLLLESRRQLDEQFESHRTETAAALLALQQQIQQQQQQATAEGAQHAVRHERQQAELARHEQTIQQLSASLLDEQTRAQSLQSDLQAVARSCATQEAAAATLARNLSHELLEKDALQAALALREQRILTLEQARQQLTAQLADAGVRHDAALTAMDELQASLQVNARQTADLQNKLGTAEERIARLTEQVEMEREHWRSAEQDKERLSKLVNAEHESYESTRKELTGRLADLTALQEQLTQVKTGMVTLDAELRAREAVLRDRDASLAEKQQALQLAAEAQAAALQRETALAETLAVVQEELSQAHAALQERTQAWRVTERDLAAAREAGQQASEQLVTARRQLQQMEAKQQERDQFILEQARELERLQHASSELSTQFRRAQASNEARQAHVQALEAELASRRVEQEQQALLLSQVQQDLADKRAEQGASAQQVAALQQELHQHVEALNAIRRDIHQVAQQTRHRESDLLVRTLTRVDDAGVVHLLNKTVMVVGRANDADICIHSESVSRRHACLRVGRDVVIVEDLGSTNGCHVNGKRVKRQLLKDGDKLEVGSVMFRFAVRVSQA